MKLIDDWRKKFPKLWSVRLSLLAGVASGIEAGYQTWLTGQPPWVVIFSCLISFFAAGARIIAQPSVTNNGK